MAMVDMPLSELLKYQGQSPRPRDFDKFWEKSLKEVSKLKSDIELVPLKHPSPIAEVYDLYFTGTGGSRIHALFLKPKKITKPVPAVVEFHGYSGNCGSITSKLSYVAMGYAVASLDCRGQGGKSEDLGGVKGTTLRGHIIRGIESPETLLFRQIYMDCAQLVKIVMEMKCVDAGRIATNGGSQGGGLSVAAAALVPEVACCVSCFPFLSDYKRVWNMDCSGAYEEIREYFRRHDPLHKKEEEFFNTLGYIDIQNLAERIKAPVMMSVGMRDTVCPPSTIYATFNKIKSPKNMLVYHDFGHEGLQGWDDEIFNFMAKNLK